VKGSTNKKQLLNCQTLLYKNITFITLKNFHVIFDLGKFSVNFTLEKCKHILRDYYGDKFQGLILYGSMARGQTDKFSDMDLLVLLNEPFNYFQELRQIVELLYPVQLESENLISAKPAAKEEFESGKILLYRLARREGVAA
jgi:predicted nucleotidyltransferase